MPKIKLIVDGGNMKPGPAVAQQLGPMGINIGKVTQEVNSATSGFKGMKVPVEIDVESKTKSFTIHVFSPPVAELIKKEIKVEKGSGTPGRNFIGNLAIEQVIAVAKTKLPNMLAKDLKSAVRLVVGSCVSLGILVENKSAKQIEEDIEQGVYSKEIKSEKTDVSDEKKQKLAKYFDEVRTKQEAEAKALEAAKAAEEAAKAAAATAAQPGAPAVGVAPVAGTPATTAPTKKEEKPAKKK